MGTLLALLVGAPSAQALAFPKPRDLNATEEMVRRYVETLHDTVREVGGRFFTPDRAKQLLHNSLVPARITCYVSTNFGVAVEYSSAPRTTIESRRGSARVEDLIFQAPSRLKDVGPMFRIAGSNTAFIGLVLADAFPMRLNTEDSDVTLRNVSFACDALRWKRELEYAELYGSRRASRWSTEAAQSRAKDEILAALFLAQRADKFSTKLEEYVASFRRKTVLVLGSYDPEGKRRLQSIAAALEQTGYEPVLVQRYSGVRALRPVSKGRGYRRGVSFYRD